jgi:hypothetical protein
MLMGVSSVTRAGGLLGGGALTVVRGGGAMMTTLTLLVVVVDKRWSVEVVVVGGEVLCYHQPVSWQPSRKSERGDVTRAVHTSSYHNLYELTIHSSLQIAIE